MLLGFKDQFEPFVLDGSKTHTIRAGDRWKVGMRADLYVRPRRPDMRLLFRAPVIRVEMVFITVERFFTQVSNYWRISLTINGQLLDRGETELFLWRDGFRDGSRTAIEQATDFWRKTVPFSGQIVHWDYRRAVWPPSPPTCRLLPKSSAALSALGKKLHAPDGGWIR